MLVGLAGCHSAPFVEEDRHDEKIGSTTAGGSEAISSCRVAVAISGDVRSSVDPAVHRSFRRYVVEAIEKANCLVDVFAYAMLEDDVDLLLEVSCYKKVQTTTER